MKRMLLLLASVAVFGTAQAQEARQVPLITVNGEGKIKVAPDQVSINVSVETTGVKAADVKKQNDAKIDAVLKYIKKSGIAEADFQTQRVNLNDQYDYEKKKHNYVATQTVSILIKDLNKYDPLMEGLVDQGVNNISNIQFKSSKEEALRSDARRNAILDAKKKAQDYVNALGQKMGAAYTIVDNTTLDYPRPMYEVRAMAMADKVMGNETLAAGEVEITANVNVSFLLVN